LEDFDMEQERWCVIESDEHRDEEISWHKTFDKAKSVAIANAEKTGLLTRVDFELVTIDRDGIWHNSDESDPDQFTATPTS